MWRYLWLIMLSMPVTTQAFYHYQQDDWSVEARGLLHGLALAANNPNDKQLFSDDKLLGGALSGRLMLDGLWQNWQIELHGVQSYQQDKLQTGGRRFSFLRDVERSDAFDWRFASADADFAIDRLNLQFGKDNLNLKVGRQPINLAASFYFTPNDFFAPFAAQTFYRTYKPGVDAARVDWQWQELSQLTLLAVLDYDEDESKATGWQSSPDWGNTSYLARLSSLIGNTQWGLLLAEIDNDTIIGFDFQGELLGLLGIRGEGHSRFYDEATLQTDTKVSVSVEYRLNSRASLRWEQFYQRSGASDEHRYPTEADDVANREIYLAKHYTALGGSYELSPLLNTDVLVVYNHNDHSSLLAFYANYSLSDEAELALGVNMPIGEQPNSGRLNSEFGAYPKLLTVEIRTYF